MWDRCASLGTSALFEAAGFRSRQHDRQGYKTVRGYFHSMEHNISIFQDSQIFEWAYLYV
jgi:hypothetical protein